MVHGIGTPATRAVRRVPRWLLVLNVAYVLLLAFISISNAIGPETWWFGSANLYLPQWVWALPGLPLLLITLVCGWRLAWLPLFCLAYVAGPLMGYCWHPGKPPTTAGVRLRVMTYNIKWYERDKEVLTHQFVAYHPDLIQIQDGSNAMNGSLRDLLDGWNVRTDGQYLVASRFPLTDLDSIDISYPGGHHHATRATLTVDGVPITVIDAHLLSPREGLEGVRHRQVDSMTENASARLAEANALARHLHEISGPVIVTGDLNSPVQGLTCRVLFDVGYKDAFSTAGNVLDCTVGDARGSDHSPVIADLLLPTGTTNSSPSR
jgi:endonuclease/exonuclease/phosphatase (EEP) superfamily protein YafD